MEFVDYSSLPGAIIRALFRSEPLDFDTLKVSIEELEGKIVVEQILAEVLHEMRTRGVIAHGGDFTNIRRVL